MRRLAFTDFERLTVEMGRMAATGSTGSLAEWHQFIHALEDALNEARTPSPSSAEELAEALQQYVNGVETGMLDSPADEILANVTKRAKAALTSFRKTTGGEDA